MEKEREALCTGEELRKLYDPGIYVASQTIYDGQKWYPREITAEHQWFKHNVNFRVGEQQGYFYLDTIEHQPIKDMELSLLVNRRWKQIPWTDLGYEISMDDIHYRVDERFPVHNGMCLIAFHDHGQDPKDADVRELRLNFW